MKYLGRVPLALLAILILSLSFVPPAQPQSSVPTSGRKAVLIELFTSEGCSSCPPADAVLQQLVAQQPVHDVEIIALEEHVDYWNHDGWTDPYSSDEWTERQKAYAFQRKTDPYTPELVIDGQNQIVGSREQDVLRDIAQAAQAAKTEVRIDPENSGGQGPRHFRISVDKLETKPHDTAEVWLAVTEDGLHSQVNAGENNGRMLTHVATLRSLRKIGAVESSSVFAREIDVKLDSHWKAENLHATVFVQRKKGLQIIGAASTRFVEPTSSASAAR